MSPNPIVNMLSGNGFNPVAGLFGLMKSGGDPMMMLKLMSAQDDRMKKIYDVIQQYGGDPQKAFYSEADKQGANTDEILQQARSVMQQ